MAAIQQERMLWLDWMKVLAILSIVWGHFFSAGYVYLYVFSVQVFCVISGFLYKKTPNWTICVKKCFWQLFVPTIIMSTMMHLEAYLRCHALGATYNMSWTWFFEWLILGHRWCMGPCWYFYSLIVMRLIMQAFPEKKWVYIILFVILSGIAIFLHHIGFEMNNANVNVVVCMPLFLIGVLLKSWKMSICELHNYCVEVGLLTLSLVIVIMCGHYNGYVWMYKNGYGDNFALYLIGGMAGMTMLYSISQWLSRFPYKRMVFTISRGCILIIGLHIIIVRRLTELPNRMWGEDLLFSLMIILCFVPIINLAELFFPMLLGQYKR